MVKKKQPNLILYENTNYIHKRTADALSLFRLLGALECLAVKQIEKINVLKVKKISKELFAGKANIPNLQYLPGRGKGWMFNNSRISIHQLEAFIVYYLHAKKYNK